MTYGLPTGTNIAYGAAGFPAWVYALCTTWGLQASTYPGHQESERAEAGFAPNPDHLNRGIDWAGPVSDMQRFAGYLLTIRQSLEQVIFENPDTGQHVGVAGGDDVTDSPYYADDYGNHTDHVHTRQSQPIPLPQSWANMRACIHTRQEGNIMAGKPAFNEFALWSSNNSPRTQKPSMLLLHTQESGGGDAAAETLARWFQDANNVSYHYTISQAADNGVTVVDCVDTDLASWSVLDYNNRSINLCFAGSSASWSRAQWLTQGRAIDVAAYLAVQDAAKYGFKPVVVPPPYNGAPGISDHAYVTHMGVGTHTDVGSGFPWDVFAAAVAKYSGTAPAPAPPTPPVPAPTPSRTPWDQSALREVVALAKAGDARANLLLDVIEVVNPAALQQFIAKGS